MCLQPSSPYTKVSSLGFRLPLPTQEAFGPSKTAQCCQLRPITQRLTHALINNLCECLKEILDLKEQLKASTKFIGNLTTQTKELPKNLKP
jgi:hypothetical protein